MIPYFVAFGAVACYALLGPIAKKVGAKLPPFGFIALSSFLLTLVSTLIASVYEREAMIATWAKIEWRWFLFFSLLSFLGYIGYLWAIARMPIAHYEMFAIICPIIGGLMAVAMLGEPFHLRYLIGLAFMAIGLFIALKPL